MTEQLSLFDVLRAPPLRVPVDKDGHVLQGDPDETIRLPHEKPGWRGCDRVQIELHREPEGWMWSVSMQFDQWGCGYKVGRKWGRFAATRDDALHYAAKEAMERLSKSDGGTAPERRAREWLGQWL